MSKIIKAKKAFQKQHQLRKKISSDIGYKNEGRTMFEWMVEDYFKESKKTAIDNKIEKANEALKKVYKRHHKHTNYSDLSHRRKRTQYKRVQKMNGENWIKFEHLDMDKSNEGKDFEDLSSKDKETIQDLIDNMYYHLIENKNVLLSNKKLINYLIERTVYFEWTDFFILSKSNKNLFYNATISVINPVSTQRFSLDKEDEESQLTPYIKIDRSYAFGIGLEINISNKEKLSTHDVKEIAKQFLEHEDFFLNMNLSDFDQLKKYNELIEKICGKKLTINTKEKEDLDDLYQKRKKIYNDSRINKWYKSYLSTNLYEIIVYNAIYAHFNNELKREDVYGIIKAFTYNKRYALNIEKEEIKLNLNDAFKISKMYKGKKIIEANLNKYMVLEKVDRNIKNNPPIDNKLNRLIYSIFNKIDSNFINEFINFINNEKYSFSKNDIKENWALLHLLMMIFEIKTSYNPNNIVFEHIEYVFNKYWDTYSNNSWNLVEKLSDNKKIKIIYNMIDEKTGIELSERLNIILDEIYEKYNRWENIIKKNNEINENIYLENLVNELIDLDIEIYNKGI